MDEDKVAAYQTLYSCLESVALLAAPIAPFFMENLFLDLNAVSHRFAESSVHQTAMPAVDESLIDKDLEERMELAQLSSSMILALRRKVNIKVRQPLAKLVIPILDDKLQEQFQRVQSLVLNEVNVKEVEFIRNTEGLITKKIKPNFKTLGKRYGKQMKEIASAFAVMDQKSIAEIERSGMAEDPRYLLQLAGGDVVLERGDYEITSEDMPGWLVASEGKLTVALDITISEALKREGTARELVNRIQNLRKESGFDVTDKIVAIVEKNSEIVASLEDYLQYVCSQTLCNNIELQDAPQGAAEVEWGNNETLRIKISRV